MKRMNWQDVPYEVREKATPLADFLETWLAEGFAQIVNNSDWVYVDTYVYQVDPGDSVAGLHRRYETPYGVEIIVTVHQDDKGFAAGSRSSVIAGFQAYISALRGKHKIPILIHLRGNDE